MKTYPEFEASVTFGSATPDQQRTLGLIRQNILNVARGIFGNLPDGHERYMALTVLRDLIWAQCVKGCCGQTQHATAGATSGA